MSASAEPSGGSTSQPTFAVIVTKAAALPAVTYFVVGFLAFTLFDDGDRCADPVVGTFMRPTSDPWVVAALGVVPTA